MTTRVAVLGARGRMGSEVVRAVEAAADLGLAAALDAGDPLDLSGADVAVDFTHPDAVMANLRACVDAGVHAVVGTTGFDDARLAELRSWLRDGGANRSGRQPDPQAPTPCSRTTPSPSC